MKLDKVSKFDYANPCIFQQKLRIAQVYELHFSVHTRNCINMSDIVRTCYIKFVAVAFLR
jgi:hypothetical protein